MSPISVQTMIQHCYCDSSFSHLTRQDGVPVWWEEEGGICWSAWHWVGGHRIFICDPSTATVVILSRHMDRLRKHCQDVTIIFTCLLLQWVLPSGNSCFFTVGSILFFLPPTWSQDTFTIWEEFDPWKQLEQMKSTWPLEDFLWHWIIFCDLFLLHNETTSSNSCGMIQSNYSSVILRLKLLERMQTDGQQQLTLI